MNTPESNPRRTRLDEATSRRLAKLHTVPMDTSQLLKAVEAQIPRPQAQARRLRLTWLKPMRAVAASLLVFGLIIALVIHSSGGPVLASADRLARIHDEVLHRAGTHVTAVDSVSAANAALASKCPGLPAVPELPKDHVMSCCVHDLGRKKLACVAILVDEVPVSIAVADVADVKMPTCQALMIGGVAYHVQSEGDINMVMTERGGRWVCVMGKLPVNRLAELASSLRF
jgi:hypothetical protein